MKLNNIFKKSLKQLRCFLKKNILVFFYSFKSFKKENLNNFKNKKFFLIFIILFFCLLLILFTYYFVSTKEDEINNENVEVEENVLSDDEIKEIEVEKRGEEETVYGILGNFWLEIDTEELKIKAPIIEGITGEETVDKEILDKGVGHHLSSPYPNRESGNVVLSGHRWFPGDVPARTVFIDLDKLKVDDEVRVYFDGEEFIYKITGTKIIDYTETYILDRTENPTITIYTCTPKYPVTKPTKRLVYFGELIK